MPIQALFRKQPLYAGLAGALGYGIPDADGADDITAGGADDVTAGNGSKLTKLSCSGNTAARFTRPGSIPGLGFRRRIDGRQPLTWGRSDAAHC